MTPEIHYRPTRALINLDAIKENVRQLKNFLQPDIHIMAVVKANAYGHGDVEVAKASIEAGATMLAVATPDEAVHIRKHFPSINIIILGYSPVSFAKVAAEENIILTVYSSDWVKQIDDLPQPLKVHIKVDSGMGRIGITNEKELLDLYSSIEQTNSMIVDGVFTHFATADEEDDSYFSKQVEKFNNLVNLLPKRPRIVHAANTATMLLKDPKIHFDAVRFGISMYGLAPSNYVKTRLPFPLKEAFSLETELVSVKLLQKGDSVGYGASFTAEDEVYVGTIPIGYADGLIRKLGGQEVLVDGKRVPIIGRICMDQCMIALPHAYNIGEKVTLLGMQNKEIITIDEWAEKVETINYEIPCLITARVPRIYYKK